MLPQITDPNVLVGPETRDDAAVYRLTDGLALVLTLDFFTPIVDDPYGFGQIAAANSLSDVYAMGGRPIAMLSTNRADGRADTRLFLPPALTKSLDGPDLEKVLFLRDEMANMVWAVVGLRHLGVWRNVGARPGDALVLTKPLGTGIISWRSSRPRRRSGRWRRPSGHGDLLNRSAAAAAAGVPVHAVTGRHGVRPPRTPR
jgi:selenide,water dikinase